MKTTTVSRRAFLRFSGAAAGIGLLAACAPVAAPTGDSSGGSAGMAEPVTIRYGRHDPAAGVQTTLDGFHEAQSNIMVEVEQIGEFHAKIPALAAAGTLPDVVRSWEAMALDMGRNNQFIDIQPFVDAQDDFDPEDFYENWWNYPVLDGARYGIPDAAAPHVTFYNADLFDAAGVEYPSPDGFTWTEFEGMARGISDPDNQVWGSETIPVGWHMFSVKQVWQNGGSFYSDDFLSCTIDEPAAIEAIQYWADLLLDGNIMPSPSQIVGIGGAGAAAELLAAGQLGMQRMGSWITGTLVEAGFRFNVVPEPHSTQQDTITHGAFNAISTSSEHKDAAWTWINANCSTDGIYNYASEANFPGTRRSSNAIEPFPWVAEVDFDVDWDVIPNALEYGHILPGPANEGEALKFIGDALENIYAGDGTAAELFPEVATRVTEVISDI
ncbi:MAG: sugar ABC transporter substrate-binding protein [Chloroflexota bacterium]